MNKLIVLFVLCLGVPAFASAQDPLAPSNMPAIDTNCSHSQYASNIWMTNTMQKVLQNTGSPATNACVLTVYGTQNEFVDFQVHFHDTGSGTPNLSVTVSSFGQSLPNSSSINCSNLGQCIVYREAYMNVTGIVTNSNSPTYYGTQGYYPDILIPAKDPYWGQTTSAFPFTVASGNNQSVWVDVLIPSSAPAGYYLGSVVVKSGSTTLATMPVIIAVWQWPSAQGSHMPSKTTLRSELSSWSYDGLCTQMYAPGSTANTNLCGAYPGAAGTNDTGVTQTFLDADMMMNDHRFGSGGAENIYPGSGSFSTYASLMGAILNGTGTCNLHNGSGTTCPILPSSRATTKQIGLAANIYSSAIYNNWLTNFSLNGWTPTVTLYDYLCDEPPNGCTWANLVSNGNTRHGYASPSIPELVTTDLADATSNSALNAIDIMVPIINEMDPQGGSLQRSTYNTWLAGNCCGAGSSPTRQLWSYQSCESAGTCGNGVVGVSYATWPNYSVDGKPAANRAMEWLTFLHNQSGELYYSADICMTPQSQGANCGYPSHAYDPWVSVYYSGGWGDGTLVYAGGIVSGKPNYMGADVTIPLILPSVRLKHIRDGMQDYEYLNVLTNAGKGAFVQQQISSWITNSYTFETSGTGLQTARLTLGNALHQLTYPVALAPPPSLTGTLQ
jgi:hypothetical protein